MNFLLFYCYVALLFAFGTSGMKKAKIFEVSSFETSGFAHTFGPGIITYLPNRNRFTYVSRSNKNNGEGQQMMTEAERGPDKVENADHQVASGQRDADKPENANLQAASGQRDADKPENANLQAASGQPDPAKLEKADIDSNKNSADEIKQVPAEAESNANKPENVGARVASGHAKDKLPESIALKKIEYFYPSESDQDFSVTIQHKNGTAKVTFSDRAGYSSLIQELRNAGLNSVEIISCNSFE